MPDQTAYDYYLAEARKLGIAINYCSGRFSRMWRKITNKECPFNLACVEHDCAYYCGGGGRFARLKADATLWKRIWDGGMRLPNGRFVAFEYADGYKQWYGWVWATPMFLAVRLFGWAYWPGGYEWGYHIKELLEGE